MRRSTNGVVIVAGGLFVSAVIGAAALFYRERQPRSQLAPTTEIASHSTGHRAAPARHAPRLQRNSAFETPSPGVQGPETKAERRRQLLADLESRLQKHAREETRDSSWAGKAESAARADLARRARALRYEVLGVDCRSTTCVARLKWPSYEAARVSYRGLWAFDRKPNCTRIIILPPKSGGAGDVIEVNILDECSEAPAQGLAPIQHGSSG